MHECRREATCIVIAWEIREMDLAFRGIARIEHQRGEQTKEFFGIPKWDFL